MARTADEIMKQMGFADTDRGPYVIQLRESIARQVRDHGLAGASYGTWVGNPSAEERAKAHLAVWWSIEHGHGHQTECLDCFPINRRFSTKDMRWHYEFRPDRIAPWVRDQIRVLGYHVRVLRDRVVGAYRSSPSVPEWSASAKPER